MGIPAIPLQSVFPLIASLSPITESVLVPSAQVGKLRLSEQVEIIRIIQLLDSLPAPPNTP